MVNADVTVRNVAPVITTSSAFIWATLNVKCILGVGNVKCILDNVGNGVANDPVGTLYVIFATGKGIIHVLFLFCGSDAIFVDCFNPFLSV